MFRNPCCKSRFVLSVMFLLVAPVLAVPGKARAQEAGVEPVPGRNFSAGRTILNEEDRVSRTGELRYWRAYSSHGARVMLKVFRLENERLVLVGASPLVGLPPGEQTTFSCSIPVARGDLIGCFCPDTNCVDRLETGDALLAQGDVGTTVSSTFQSEIGVPSIAAGSSLIFDVPSSASTNLLVPVVARGPGANDSLWKTSLELFNTSEEETQVALYFNLADIDNTQPAASSQIVLPARGALMIDDLLLDSFQYEEASGSLDIVASAPILAHGHIINTGSSVGNFGQGVPALPVCWAMGDDGRTGLDDHAGVATLFMMLDNDEIRTNLGIANVSGSPLSLKIRAFDKTSPLGEILWVSLPPFSQTQINRILRVLGLNSAERNIRIEISAAAGTAGRFLAYASRVNNSSGDAIFISAVHEGPLN